VTDVKNTLQILLTRDVLVGGNDDDDGDGDGVLMMISD